MVKYCELEVKDALHRLTRRGLPYKYDLNIYRGCSHGCKYCYGVKSHSYLNSESFQDEIFVKTNISDRLEETLASTTWVGETINFGGVCDSYQEGERQFKLMPDLLRLMIKYKNPIVISTKSDLIMRDIDLIAELAEVTTVKLAICITSIDKEVSKRVEPGASLPRERYIALKELSKTKARVGLHFFPILPFLSDDEESLEKMVKAGANSGADYIMCCMLYMSGGIRKRYLDFIQKEYPEYYGGYLGLYNKGSANKEYKAKIHGFLKNMKSKYRIDKSY
ncbi:MAG: hypothetical protein APF76_17055 [Desulfitibacter sp. BRH_c19]|nr:MAG: hypothetical protein APF76_17055 [Desulfitibacter sp. BRH_c19]